MSRSLGDFLHAQHICVVGATESSFAGSVTQRNLRRCGYQGRISQVHPRHRLVDGHPCVPALTALDAAPDIIVVLAPARALCDVLREAESVGVGWAVIPGAGEADAGAQAAVVAAFLDEPERTIRVVGPNCMGIAAPPERLYAYIGSVPAGLRCGTVALLSQSGAVVEAFISQEPRIGYRLLASTGNERHLTTEEVIEYLLDEGDTEVVLLCQEGVNDPQRYLRLLGRAADAGVRIGIVRAGRSAVSRQAVLTHTGAISGDWDLWTRLARRQGAVVLDTLDELQEFGVLASSSHRPRSARTWIVTNSGGQGSLIVDVLAAAAHVQLPAPTEAHRSAFAAAFPQAGAPSNPMDLWGLAAWQHSYPTGFGLIAEHGGGGTLVVAVDAAPDQGLFEGGMAAGIVRAASAATDGDDTWRVVHLAVLAAPAHHLLAAALNDTGCPSIRGAAGVRALAGLVAPSGPRIDEAQLALIRPAAADSDRLDHAAALALVARYQVAVPATILARDPASAALEASRLRSPLVVKVVGPAHRAAVGGVALGVDTSEVEAVCAGMASIDGAVGFELTEHVVADLELLVHVSRDGQLGPRATVGVGGALTETAHATVCDLAPVTDEAGHALVERLVGHAAAHAAWARLVGSCLRRLGDAVRAGDADEIEINPLSVDRLAARAVAVDVLARGGDRE